MTDYLLTFHAYSWDKAEIMKRPDRVIMEQGDVFELAGKVENSVRWHLISPDDGDDDVYLRYDTSDMLAVYIEHKGEMTYVQDVREW